MFSLQIDTFRISNKDAYRHPETRVFVQNKKQWFAVINWCGFNWSDTWQTYLMSTVWARLRVGV